MNTLFFVTRSWLILLATVEFVFAGSSEVLKDGIDGIYVGNMQIHEEGVHREIPLSLSLLLTDEIEATPAGNINIIDSAFVVDEEGGPYNFTRVSYDFESNKLDLKYSRGRPGYDPNTSLPASLRFIAHFETNGVIEGEVHSGLVGALGSFRLQKNSGLSMLPIRLKYHGKWEGDAHFVRSKKNRPIGITLQKSTNISLNPPNLELDFTPGRICGYNVEDTLIVSYKHVSIDYLRRKVYASDGEGLVSLEMSLDDADQSITGFSSSAAWGLTTTFAKLLKSL